MASVSRDAKLLSMSSSLRRSTIDVRQFSFCPLSAAFVSSYVTTATAELDAGAAADAVALDE